MTLSNWYPSHLRFNSQAKGETQEQFQVTGLVSPVSQGSMAGTTPQAQQAMGPPPVRKSLVLCFDGERKKTSREPACQLTMDASRHGQQVPGQSERFQHHQDIQPSRPSGQQPMSVLNSSLPAESPLTFSQSITISLALVHMSRPAPCLARAPMGA